MILKLYLHLAAREFTVRWEIQPEWPLKLPHIRPTILSETKIKIYMGYALPGDPDRMSEGPTSRAPNGGLYYDICQVLYICNKPLKPLKTPGNLWPLAFDPCPLDRPLSPTLYNTHARIHTRVLLLFFR